MQFTGKATKAGVLAATVAALAISLTACGGAATPAPAAPAQQPGTAAGPGGPGAWSSDQLSSFEATPGAGADACTGPAIAKTMAYADAMKVVTVQVGSAPTRQDVLTALTAKYGAAEAQVDFTQFFAAVDNSGCPGTANG
ncbi:MAG TPA: hypothetical protein VGH57_33840 [Amycolatopsis sp.]|jgi:hypothetical protein